MEKLEAAAQQIAERVRQDGDRRKRKTKWGDCPPGTEPRKKRKLYVPNEDFPDIDFVSLLTGPQGRTQRELEIKSQSKISIRGRV